MAFGLCFLDPRWTPIDPGVEWEEQTRVGWDDAPHPPVSPEFLSFYLFSTLRLHRFCSAFPLNERCLSFRKCLGLGDKCEVDISWNSRFPGGFVGLWICRRRVGRSGLSPLCGAGFPAMNYWTREGAPRVRLDSVADWDVICCDAGLPRGISLGTTAPRVSSRQRGHSNSLRTLISAAMNLLAIM